MNTITIAEFWQNHKRFLKNNLITEAPNPKTHNLSNLCHTNLALAFILFKQAELDAVIKLKKYIYQILNLCNRISPILCPIKIKYF